MKNKVFLLFSDGTWTFCNEIIKEEIIANHWWPFPLDKEGDPRREVIVVGDGFRTYIKGV